LVGLEQRGKEKEEKGKEGPGRAVRFVHQLFPVRAVPLASWSGRRREKREGERRVREPSVPFTTLSGEMCHFISCFASEGKEKKRGGKKRKESYRFYNHYFLFEAIVDAVSAI